MKKIIFIVTVLLTSLCLFNNPVLAQTKAKTTAAKLPTFVTGQNNTVDKAITGDLMVAGGQNKISSTITGDTYVAGGQVNISGTVTGNLIVAGGDITISGKINKNLIVAGGQVMLDNLSSVNGYVLVGGGKVTLQGSVLGSVKVGAGSLLIGDKAVISGNLEADVGQSEIASGAKIGGTKTVNIHQPKTAKTMPTVMNQWKNVAVAGGIYGFLSKLVVLLVLIKIFSKSDKLKNLELGSFWSDFGWGLVVLIVAPFLFLILMATVVGIPLALIMLALYLVALYLSGIVVSIVLGKLMADKKILKTDNIYLLGGVGLLLLVLLQMIPFVGGLVRMITLVLGIGILYKKVCQNKNA